MEFLAQYGLFLAKSITLLVCLLLAFSMCIVIAQKGKRSSEGILFLTHLNEKFDDIRYSLQSETLPKREWKKWLKIEKKDLKEKKKEGSPRLFVIRFSGDIRASEVNGLREMVSAIIQIATPIDKVMVILESTGGFVHSYGLAASQLQRLRQQGLHLTVAIDKFAASGGYLMACVANHIIAAPFAIVGSIGVIAQLPNFHRLLNKHEIDFELHTAGEYKRTLTLFGENTPQGREKFQEELEETHLLFKEHILQYRPQVDIETVATGAHWHAIQAIKLNLVDQIQTSDDFILTQLKAFETFEIVYEEKQKIAERISQSLFHMADTLIAKLMHLRPQI